MAPDSMTDDGYLNLCMTTERLNRRQMLGLIVEYTKGTQSGNPLVATARARHVRFFAPLGGLVCHADGETIAINGDEIEVTCIPAALRVLVPS
jgi:diacylglycerol kinase family enzyme